MASVNLESVGVQYEVISERSRSLRNRALRFRNPAATSSALNSENFIVSALEDISLTALDSERIGVMGSNGSGKSTLLRVLNGILRPTSGTLRIDGSVASLIDLAAGFDGELDGIENIFLKAELHGLTRKKVKQELDAVVEFSGLEDSIFRPVRTFSSGMKMRLGFSVALMLRREILLLDEWLSVGDEAFRVKAEAALEDIKNNSSILFLASHNRLMLETICHRGIVLKGGKVVFDGPINDATNHYFGIRATAQ